MADQLDLFISAARAEAEAFLLPRADEAPGDGAAGKDGKGADESRLALESTLAWCTARGLLKKLADAAPPQARALSDHVGSLSGTDLMLVSACLHNRPAAWKRIVAEIESLKAPLTRRYSNHGSMVDDVLDDLHSHLIAEAPSLSDSPDLKMRIGTYAGTASLRGWLCAIAARRMVTRMKKESRSESLGETEPSAGQTSGTSAESVLMREAVRSALESLTPKEQLIARMHWFDGLTGVAIAERQRLTPARIAQILGQIKDKLRRKLADEFG